jgi:crotonobetainyl-CoA:carnitine CoA-transferase CaiB-like acyl-CoA transferase
MPMKVFEGIKVAEFAWIVVGPSASLYLAEHGATVIKIESHKRLDTMRGTSPFVNNIFSPDASMAFGRPNANKLSVTLDLQNPEGRKLAWKLIQWADIVTESFSPGNMEKWGLDYASIRKVKPEIIYMSSSMQGRGGPHSAYAGYGMNAVNLCGFSEVSGWPDRKPAAPHGAYTDYVNARFLALALIAALDYRARTGKGQYIEQSQFETALHFFSPPLMDYQINGRIIKRDGNRVPQAAPHGLFPCRGEDRWVAIEVLNEDHWRRFCRATGQTELIDNPEFDSLGSRKKHEDALEQLVSAWTCQYTAEAVQDILQKAGVPAHMVAKHADVFTDPQLQHRRHFVSLDQAVMGRQKFEPQSAFILSKTPREITTPSPCLGEHNEYVFKNILKMSDEEISQHILDGSITTELPGTFKTSM